MRMMASLGLPQASGESTRLQRKLHPLGICCAPRFNLEHGRIITSLDSLRLPILDRHHIRRPIHRLIGLGDRLTQLRHARIVV